MKKLQCFLMAACLAVVPMLQSCDDSDGFSVGDFSYPEWATVRVTGNAFYVNCDRWGTLLPVNTDLGWYKPADGQRILTVFNPLWEDYQGYDYGVKLLEVYNALTKEVEDLTEENEAEFGNDGVTIYKGDIGIGGGYMNIIFLQNIPSKTKHRISLVQRAETTELAGDGYVHLELRYNDYDDLTGLYSSGLVSFNLSKLNITTETKGIKLKMNSAVNGEVELTFDLKQTEGGNTEKATGYDFSKMQLE